MKSIQLHNGDGLMITPESKEFNFQCCGCGSQHLIKIERDGENITLRFYEVKGNQSPTTTE